jgi:hypothetical protein
MQSLKIYHSRENGAMFWAEKLQKNRRALECESLRSRFAMAATASTSASSVIPKAAVGLPHSKCLRRTWRGRASPLESGQSQRQYVLLTEAF